MNIDIEKLKKKIIYRSQYRGTREMDKLLFSFVTEYIDKIENSKLLLLEKFLEIDDEDLYKYYNGNEAKLKFEDEYIVKLFKNFKYNK